MILLFQGILSFGLIRILWNSYSESEANGLEMHCMPAGNREKGRAGVIEQKTIDIVNKIMDMERMGYTLPMSPTRRVTKIL